MAEMPEPDAGGQGRNPQSTAVGASNVATNEGTPSRPIVVTMEEVVERANMREAYTRVVRNHGAPGIDGMSVEALGDHLRTHWPQIKQELLNDTYRPQPVRAVEIPKPNGGVRQLGIPTVMDRMIQQALHQKLEGVFEPGFSDSSFGFRRGRSTHQAILRAQEYVRQGYDWVVDIDLEKFFDNVHHDILMARIAKKVADKRILKLIRNYLQAGIMIGGVMTVRREGTPQGSPLSPLLSNIMLTGLDRELERRGHRFCRYADDCNIYVKSERAGQRVMESITVFLAKRLKLKVNAQKSTVGRPWEVKYLGFSMTVDRKRRLKPAKRSVDRLKEKIRELMRKGRGCSVAKTIAALNPILRGWANYFKICEVTKVFEELDGWIRRKVRAILWRQWKRGETRFRYLLRYGLDPETAKRSASNGRGPWWNAGAAHMNRAISVKRFQQWGLMSLLDIVSRKVN